MRARVSGRPFPTPWSLTSGVEIRCGCQFIISLFHSLTHLSGGLARFLPCFQEGSLKPAWAFRMDSMLSWSLSSSPHESGNGEVPNSLFELLDYRENSVSDLSGGSLEVRFCASLFCKKRPSGNFFRFLLSNG